MKILTFRCHRNRWYLDMPDVKADMKDLRMVKGTDKLLQRLSYKEETVELAFANAPIDNFYRLKRISYTDQGAMYKVSGSSTFPPEIWLPNIIKKVLGNRLPEELYFYPTFLL